MIRAKNFDLKKGSEFFKAFNDEARVRILNLVFQHQEMCISDLELILFSIIKYSGVFEVNKVT